MNSGQASFSKNRRAASNIVILVMGSIIALLLIVVLVVLLKNPSSGSNNRGAKKGETVNKSDLPDKKEPPKPVGDPERVKEVLQAGKTYVVVLKGGFNATCEDTDWGVTQVVNLGYLMESQMTRKIESNDGRRITEVRTFDKVHCVKVLAEVESVSINLGMPGKILIQGLDYLEPGLGTGIQAAVPTAEKFLKFGAQKALDNNSVKAFAYVDGLQGKSVRLVYDDQEAQVISVTPLNGDLDPDQLAFVRESTLAADCYIMPNTKSKPGDSWTMPGGAFADFIDPTMKRIPTGTINLTRGADTKHGDKTFAMLEVKSGTLQLLSTESGKHTVGTFSPRGKLEYNITDGYTENGDLKADMSYEELSTNHILFQAKLRFRPTVEMNYHCEMSP